MSQDLRNQSLVLVVVDQEKKEGWLRLLTLC